MKNDKRNIGRDPHIAPGVYYIQQELCARIDGDRIIVEKKESEDERIKRCIADCVSWFGEDSDLFNKHNLTKVQVLTYIKKQKESLHITETCKENADSFTDGIIEVRSFQRGMEEGKRQEQEKQKEQKPAEWSEEDCDKVAQYLHDRDGGMLWSKATEITSDILDILHPRPSWKPSKEQMKALKWWSELPSCSPGLKSLYEDLKIL